LAPVQLRQGEASALASECTACHGHWLEPGELARLTEVLLEIRPVSLAQAQQRPMRCPKCLEIEMSKVALRDPKAGVDVCPKCHGTWLDGNDLEAIRGERPLTTLVNTYLFVRDGGARGT
jgi:Zn-finger nucleic acid-binding protein